MINDRYDQIIRKVAVRLSGSFTNMALQVVDGSVSSRSQLAQARPTDTNNLSILAPASGETLAVGTIVICNSSANDVTYRVFHDNNGTTFDQTTALFYDATIRGNSTLALDLFIAMNDSTGNLAVRSSEASALTFTVYGITLV